MPPGLLLLLSVLPLALAAAISPTVVTAQVLLLGSGPKGLARAWAMALGRTTALLLVSVTGAVVLDWVGHLAQVIPSVLEGSVFLIAGVALLVVTAVHLMRRRAAPQAAGACHGQHPRWARRASDTPPAFLFGIGFGWLLVSPSTLAPYLPALHLITQSDAEPALRAAAFAVLFAVTSVPVLAPPAAVTIRGDRVRAGLERIHHWLDASQARIMGAVGLLAGTGLAVAGTVMLMGSAGA